MSDIVGNHTTEATAHLRVCSKNPGGVFRRMRFPPIATRTHGVNDVDPLLVVAYEP